MASCDSCVLGMFEFADIINQREMLLEWLKCHGVLRREKLCDKCGLKCSLSSDFVYKCRKISYRREKRKKIKCICMFSVTARKNTFFSKSSLSIEAICKFVLCWSMLRSPRIKFMTIELQMSSHTVVNWSSFCREVCIHWCQQTKKPIGGIDVIVEIDELKLWKGTWVFGGFERGSKKMFVCGVGERNKETLLKVIKENILPGTTIISDGLKAYDSLKDEGFTHLSVDQTQNFVDPITGAHTQNIKRCWREVRGNVPKFGRKEGHLEGYLCEFLWKNSLPDHTDRIHSFFKMVSVLYNPYK